MAVTRDQKKVQLAELKEKFGAASSVVFAHYIGMNVTDLSELRRSLKKAGAEMKVAKKTLMKLASQEKGLPTIDDSELTGPVACIFSYEDPVAGPQAALKFSKDHSQVAFLGGLFEGKLLSKADAITLASIPGRQVLLATFAGMIRSPLVSFASMCNGPLSGFARGLSQLAEKGGIQPKAA